MPLIIKVAVSRKLTEDFNSRGWTLDIQSELDSRILDDTDQLAKSTNFLFQMANDLLDEQVHQASAGSNGADRLLSNGLTRNHTQQVGRLRGNGTRISQNNGTGPAGDNGNGAGPRGQNSRTERPITTAQINAVQKMAQKFDTTGDAIAQEDFNCKLSELGIRQASELIDRLKKGLQSQGEQEAGR